MVNKICMLTNYDKFKIETNQHTCNTLSGFRNRCTFLHIISISSEQNNFEMIQYKIIKSKEQKCFCQNVITYLKTVKKKKIDYIVDFEYLHHEKK